MPIRPWETPPPSTLAARPARPLSTATTALLLLAITAVGAALRFVRLDVPTLWGDEVATFGRVIGTFDELMKRLVNEGFVPLHYVAYWALGKLLPLTPANMRLIPAVTGTLMIPAAFFLARQMTTRRVALLAALLVSVSAYGLIYSRDAKMYMPNWLFVTLATGCLLHHLRSKAWWSWGGWALAGALGAATHATALLMLAVWPLMLLTHEGRRRRRDSFLFGAGVALIVAFPAWYYLAFNRYIARTAIAPAATAADEGIDPESVKWKHSGLEWIAPFNKGQTGWQLTLNSATNYLLGAQWPRAAMDPGGFDRNSTPTWFAPAVSAAMTVTVGFLLLGALPWRRVQTPPLAPRERVAASARPGEGTPGHPAPPWRSASTAAWPGAVPRDPGTALAGGERRHPLPAPPPGGEGQEPAPERPPQPWWVMLTWLAAWLILPTYGVYYCRSFEGFAPPWALLGQAWGVMGWHWLTAGLLAVSVVGLLHARPRLAVTATRVLLGTVFFAALVAVLLTGTYWLPVFAEVMAAPVLRWPVAVVGLGLLWWFAAPTTRGRVRQLGHLLTCAGVVFLACVAAWAVWRLLWHLHVQSRPGDPWQSIWMPRYLGVIWPAVMVATAALVARLPGLPLRAGAVVVVVLLNLVQPMARLTVDTEAPLAVLASDGWAAQREPVGTRLLLNLRDTEGARYHLLRDWRAMFYLFNAAGEPVNKQTFKWETLAPRLDVRVNDRAQRIAAEVNAADRGTQPARLFLWERFDHRNVPDADPLLEALGPGWRRTVDHGYATRQFWTWRVGDVWRRRVYERVE